MIKLFTGSNSYLIKSEITQLEAELNLAAERYDGIDLNLTKLPDLLMGQSLFSEKRLIIIDRLSDNKTIWPELPSFLPRLSDDISLILIEPAPDKRTKTFKGLQKTAKIKDFPLLTERDKSKIEAWVQEEASRLGLKIDQPAAAELAKRSLWPADRGAPTYNQWQIRKSLEKLSVFKHITIKEVEEYIEIQPVESVFRLFELALSGNKQLLGEFIDDISARDEPHMVLGLLAGQMFQLAALVTSNDSVANVASATGAPPFVISNLLPYSKQLNKDSIKQMVEVLAEADERIKTSKSEPWMMIRQALMKIAALRT